MDKIEVILQQRKDYVLKLYDFFNSAHPLLLKSRDKVKQRTDALLEEETNSFNQWREKIERLSRFNQEISSWISKNQGKALDDKKRAEINYLKEGFEEKIEQSFQHYLLTFTILTKSRQKWMAEIGYDFLQLSNRDPEMMKLHREIARSYPELNTYCASWKKTTIDKINHLVRASYDIERLCDVVCEHIEYIKENQEDEFASIDEAAKQYPEKTFEISQGCSLLSQLLEKFMSEQDLYAVLNKINIEEKEFKSEFLTIFGSGGFNSIRASIRLINKLQVTETKIQMIKSYFQKIQLTLQPELNKILSKKEALLALCTNASELDRITITRWIEFNYTDIFQTIDEIIKAREKLLPQSFTLEE